MASPSRARVLSNTASSRHERPRPTVSCDRRKSGQMRLCADQIAGASSPQVCEQLERQCLNHHPRDRELPKPGIATTPCLAQLDGKMYGERSHLQLPHTPPQTGKRAREELRDPTFAKLPADPGPPSDVQTLVPLTDSVKRESMMGTRRDLLTRFELRTIVIATWHRTSASPRARVVCPGGGSGRSCAHRPRARPAGELIPSVRVRWIPATV